MTENEAIEKIKYRMHTVEQVAGENGMEDLEMAIKALEEVHQYRTIGTPEELQEMKKDFAEALSDWRQYRKVGTLEECRAAMEKQKEMIAYCNENDCSDCYCNNGNWKETNRCMNNFIAEEIGQVAEIKWGDEE